MNEQHRIEAAGLVPSVNGSHQSSLTRISKQSWYLLFSNFLGMFICEDAPHMLALRLKRAAVCKDGAH